MQSFTSQITTARQHRIVLFEELPSSGCGLSFNIMKGPFKKQGSEYRMDKMIQFVCKSLAEQLPHLLDCLDFSEKRTV